MQVFFVFNCVMALSPLYLAKDELLDIALSPTQRALLGLDPAATPPATPGTTFVTPPQISTLYFTQHQPGKQARVPPVRICQRQLLGATIFNQHTFLSRLKPAALQGCLKRRKYKSGFIATSELGVTVSSKQLWIHNTTPELWILISTSGLWITILSSPK